MSGYRRGALRDGVALALVLSTATLHATCCASGWRCIAHIARVSSAEINIGTHTRGFLLGFTEALTLSFTRKLVQL